LTAQARPAQYLDGVTYWKYLYQSSQFEIRELQNKAAGLSVELESLKSLGKTATKRKAQDDLQPRRRSTRRTVAAPTVDPQKDIAGLGWQDLADTGWSAGMLRVSG
jgi:hypothetical protein